MAFIITQETYFFIASLIINVVTIAVIWQKRNSKGMYWLYLAMIAVAIYNLFALLDASSAELSGRIFWSKLEYLGASTVSPLFLIFFTRHPFQRIKYNTWFVPAVLFIPVAAIVAVMTNESHYLFWTGFQRIAGTPNGYIFLHGPFYWIAFIYNYICGIISIILIYLNTRRSSGIYHIQSLVALTVCAFPFIAGLLYSLDLNPFPGMDILPIGFSIGGLGIVLSVVFMRMFDLVPVSRTLLVENLQDGVVVLDSQKTIVDINPAAIRLFNNEKIKVGMTVDHPGTFWGIFDRTDQPFEILRKDPEISHLLSIPTPLIDENGRLAGYMYVLRNMTEIRRVEKALNQSQERYRSLIEDVVDAATIGICILDKNFHIIWVNQASLDSWFFTRESVLNKDIRETLPANEYPRAENREKILQKIFTSYRNGTYLENLEIHFNALEGKPERWVLYSSKPIRVGYYAGGRIEQLVDITEQKYLQKQVERLAITDELTGIYNRRGLFELGLHDFNRARRTNTLLSAVYLDVDYFKKLNDHYGHSQGDCVLVELVSRIQAQLRDMDIFGRYGGDEFIVLIPDASLKQAREVAERIKDTVSRSPFAIGLEQSPVTISLGVVQINHQDTFAGLLDRADACMYRAKDNGRNRIES